MKIEIYIFGKCYRPAKHTKESFGTKINIVKINYARISSKTHLYAQ